MSACQTFKQLRVLSVQRVMQAGRGPCFFLEGLSFAAPGAVVDPFDAAERF